MRQKINISTHLSTSLKAVYESFIISQTSCSISDATITNYHNHLRGIAKHIDIEMPFDELSKRHLEEMVVSMRAAGRLLPHPSWLMTVRSLLSAVPRMPCTPMTEK